MFGWFKRKPSFTLEQEKTVKVYLNPLMALLHGAERTKGSYLTQEEVLSIRDNAAFIMMAPEQASVFYRSLDAQVAVHRMNPDRLWEEWQEIRDHVVS